MYRQNFERYIVDTKKGHYINKKNRERHNNYRKKKKICSNLHFKEIWLKLFE